jgi:hypothetical protein
MEFALDHKFMNALFIVDFFLYKTLQLKMTLYVVFQKYILQILFLVFQSMENLFPYPLCVATSYLQSLNI